MTTLLFRRRLAALVPLITLFLVCLTTHPGANAGVVTGSFETRVAIETTPYHGLEPKLSFSYNSQRGNGPLGIGWTIEGLSRIERRSESGGAPRYEPGDRFYLDGNELIPCPIDPGDPYAKRASCSYASSGTAAYTAKVETFQKIAFEQSDRWTVWERDGTKRTYLPASDGASWRVSRVEDVHANVVDYLYRNVRAGEQELVEKISYIGTSLTFHWQQRSDVLSSSNGKRIQLLDVRLGSLEIRADGQMARTYAIKYSDRPLTGASSVSSLQEFGRDAVIGPNGEVTGTANPAARYVYEGDDGSAPYQWNASKLKLNVDSIAGTGDAQPPQFSRRFLHHQTCQGVFGPFVNGDFDGDGRSDVADLFPCHVDGKLKILITLVRSPENVSNSELSTDVETVFNNNDQDLRHYYFYAFASDTNGDGRQDLVIISWRPSTTDTSGPLELLVNVALSNGQGGFRWASPNFTPTGWITRFALTPWQLGSVFGPRCTVGDFSGTRRSELICIFQSETGDQFIGRAVARRDGSLNPLSATVLAPAPWPSTSAANALRTRQIVAGDVNADGLTDILILDYRPDDLAACADVDKSSCLIHFDLLTGVSNGTDFDFVRQQSPWIYGNEGDVSTLYAADVNGDGLADYLILTGKPRQQSLESIGTGVSSAPGEFILKTQTLPEALIAGKVTIALGDVDGDGATDLLVASPISPFGGIGCLTLDQEHPVLTRVLSNRDGSFALPQRWDDCRISKELMLPWDDLWITYGGFRAADTNGDGLADFLLAFRHFDSVEGHTVAIVDDVSKPTGLDTTRWTPTDTNGDGRLDFLRVLSSGQSTQASLLLQSSNGTFSSASIDLPLFDNSSVGTWRTGDFNGDGRPDFAHIECRKSLVLPGCTLYVDTFLGREGGGYDHISTFSSPVGSLFGLAEANLASWRVLDLDGTGRSSLVFLSPNQYGGEGVYVHSFTFADNWSDLGVTGPFSLGASSPFSHALDDVLTWFPADIDGDGRTDLVHVVSNVDGNRITVLRSLGGNRWALLDSMATNPTGFSWYQYPGVQSPIKWRSLDVNGDGLEDLVRTLPTPRGFVVQTLLSINGGNWSDATARPDASNAPEVLRAAGKNDWLRSGRSATAPPSLTRLDQSEGGGVTISSLLADGRGGWRIKQQKVDDPTAVEFRPRPLWSTADLLGDGRVSLVRIDAVASDHALEISSLVSASPRDLLSKVRIPAGANVEIAYRPYSAYQPDAPEVGCFLPPGLAVTVVAGLVTDDGRGAGTRTNVENEYRCPQWLPQSRRFSGWKELVTRTAAAPNRDETLAQEIYSHSEACGSSPRVSGLIDAQRRPLAFRTFVEPHAAGDPWSCMPRLVVREIMQTSADLPPRSRMEFGYDVFGNTTSIRRSASVDSGAASSTTTLSYVPNTSAWIVSAPSKIEKRQDGVIGGTLLRQRRYCYDDDATDECGAMPTRGMATRQIDLADPAHPPGRITRYMYDGMGNLKTIRNGNGHDTTITFDPNYGIYPTLYTDALGRTASEIYWDPVLSRPWRIRNGTAAPTIIEYDVLGRPKTLTLPTGGVMRRDYPDTGDPERQAVRDTLIDGSGADQWTQTFFDGLGRPYRVARSSGGWFGRYERNVEYSDSSNRPYRSSDWYCISWWPFCTPRSPLRETYEYDAAGRLTRQVHADSTEVKIAYRIEGSAAVAERTDERSVKSEVLHDSLGRLSSVRGFDDGVAAQTTYLYDAADDLVGAIDPLGNKTVFVRNLKGEVASVVDSDLGRRTVERDDVGNVTASVDAKLDRIIYSYDSLERLKTKLLPSQRLITLVYDEPASGASLGLHTSSIDTDATNCAANIVTRRNYDGAGQLAGATTCVDGVTLTFGVGHDAVGRLHSVTYPDMEEVFYAYDAAGRVRALSGIVDRIRYDAADRPRSIHFANGMLSTFSYEKNRDALRAETTWFGGARIFDAHYTYFDNLLLKTVNSYGDGSKYSYAYDGLSRLSTVRGDASTDYRYDLSGNLTYRSDLGILTYPGQGPFGCSPDLQTPQPCRLPHAVQSAGPFTFHYDGNGAAFDVERTGGSHRFIDWGGDHKPLRITDFDGAAAQYGYDGFGQRISRTTGGRTHRWFGALAEQDESGRLIKHYLIGGRRVASETSGSLSWFVSDRLNSIRAVVDASGNVIAQTKFQPFGSADPASTPGQFAGHQLEPSLPLIFMGSRLYDPAIGRFLIPDILVPSLLQTQALNRYSYVYNNPLAFVDPSGHEPWGVYGSYQSGVNFDWYGGFIGQSVYFSSSPSGVMSSVSYLQGASIVPSTSAAITVPIDWKAVAGDSAQIFLGYTMGHMEALVPGAMLREQKPVSFFFDLARAAGNLVGGAEGIGVSLEIFGVSGVGEILSGGIATPLAVGGVAAGAVVAANSSAAVAAGAGRLLNLAMSANGKSTGTQETSPRKRLTAEELKEPQAPCAYGCDEVAEDIQAIIGGDIKTLTPKEGGFLPPFREQSQGWFYHKVVVKEGRVFDRSTGLKKSLTIEEYKGLWKDREAINFDF